jgi:hypothetical protein
MVERDLHAPWGRTEGTASKRLGGRMSPADSGVKKRGTGVLRVTGDGR